MNMDTLIRKFPLLNDIQNEKEVVWINPEKVSFAESMKDSELPW
jgi:D-serine dehydratase